MSPSAALPPPAAAQVYELTEWGSGLQPVVLALGRWASASPSFPRDAEMGPDAVVLALKSTFDPANADGLSATYELVLDGLPYSVSVAGGHFEVRRGEAGHPDVTIRTDPMTLARVVFRGRSLAGAVRSGEVELEGDKRVAERLVRMLAGR